MRVILFSICLGFLVCLPSGRAGDKKEPARTLSEDAAALAGADAKQGWVSDKTLVKWDMEALEMRLAMRFAPDKDALKDGKATGKATLGMDISKDGQAEVIVHPVYGTFMLAEGKDGRTLTIKLDKATITVPYRIEGKKLVLPKGLETDNWGSIRASVKLKGSAMFDLK